MTQLELVHEVDLLEALKWIKDAVDFKKTGVEALSSFFLKDGYIHAYNGRMVVGTPFPFPLEPHLLPAKEFDRVLNNRPEGNFEWLKTEDRVVLKRGRFKSGIKTLPVDQWVWPTELSPRMQPVPSGLVDAMETLLPFVSENATKPWATCMAIIGQSMYATNNIVVAEVPCTTGVDLPEYLVPGWVAEFVCKRREGLDSWAFEEHAITFRWVDGSWMRSQLVDDKFPPVRGVIEQFYKEEPDVEITPEWRKALLRVSKITEDAVIRLRADGVLSKAGEVLDVEDDAGTPCPEGLSETVWDIRFLKDVLDIATHWNPRLYPQPASWMGPNVRGVILGRRDA